MQTLKHTLLSVLFFLTSVMSFADTTFALKTSGSLDTSKKYLIVYQSSATATSGILMNSSFTSGSTSYAQCAEAGETATISSNQITIDESNAFTFESTGTDGSYYIKNNAGYYFGNYNGSNNAGHWFAVTNTSSPGSNYYNTIGFSNSTVQITGSYNSWVLGYFTSAGGQSNVSCFHYKESTNNIYLYEEVGSSSSTTHTITLTNGTPSGQSESYYNTWTSSETPTVTLKSYSDSECTTSANYITSNLGLYAAKNSTSYFQLSVADGYTILSYKITYDISNMTSTSVSVSSGVDNTVNSQTSEAFYVKSTSTKNSKKVTPTAFTVKVKPVTYTITYSLDGGTNSADNPSTYTIETETITLADPTRDGYNFTCWTNASGTKVTFIEKGTTGDITLTANWEESAPTYSINCSATNGTVSAGVAKAKEGATVTLTLTPDAGYELSTISVKDASNNDVTVTNNSFAMPASNVTVTANFTPITYNITYNLDGGANASTNPSTYTVETETITLADPTKEDYDFAGWTNGSGTTVTSIAKGTTGDIALTANWKEKAYAINCNTAENGSISASYETAAKGTTVTITAIPVDGYSLYSISVTDANSTTVETTKNDDGTYTFKMPAAAVTVTATFSELRLDLTDSKATLIAGTYKAGNVTYTRTGSWVVDGNYSSFCLPFDINVSDATCFNKIYVPVDVAFYITSTELLKIFLINQTGTVKAGTPFVARLTGEEILLKNANEVTYDGTATNPEEVELTVFDKVNNSTSVLTSDDKIKLYWGGTLKSTEPKDGMNTFNLNGSFGPRTSTSNLSAFRAYLIETKVATVKSYELEANFLDDDETAIQTLMSAEKSGVDVYCINGVVLRKNVNAQHALDGLRPGLYVVGGKKIIKK